MVMFVFVVTTVQLPLLRGHGREVGGPRQGVRPHVSSQLSVGRDGDVVQRHLPRRRVKVVHSHALAYFALSFKRRSTVLCGGA